jgi:hypothetical protein
MRTDPLRSGLLLVLSLLGGALPARGEDEPAAPPAAQPALSPADPLSLQAPTVYPAAPDSVLSCEVVCAGEEEPFTRNRLSLQVLGGAYFSPVGVGPRVQPRFNFAAIDVRLGWMIYSPCPDHCILRGNLEALFEWAVDPVFFGFGSIVTGPSVLLRYNFVQPDWKVVPYIQGGAGIVYNDAWHDQTQRAIGQQWEFYLQAAAGLHCLLSPKWSLDLEGGYLHISNACFAERNGGINALGGSLGLTYFFGKCGH